MAEPPLDFWFDFASTYSYPAAMRIAPLAGASRRRGAVPAVPARADLQGAGLGHLAVQPLPGQGPLHVARPGAAVRRPGAAVPPPRAVSAEQPAGGAHRAGGLAQAVWGEEFCVAVFRAQFGEGRRIDDPATLERDPDRARRRCRDRARRRAVGRQQDAAARADRGGAAARHLRRADLHHARTANCSGATTGSERRRLALGATKSAAIS